MKCVKLIFSAYALFTASIVGAQAADDPIIPVIPATQEDAYTPVEIGSGWYIRGDIGGNFGAKQNSDTYTILPTTFNNNYNDAINYGVGVGYRVNQFFRVDATLEKLFKSDFGNRRLVVPEGPCNGRRLVNIAGEAVWVPGDIENCIREDISEYHAMVAMANAYVDLGTYGGFTPFIGAGVGAARVRYREETATITCVPVHESVNTEACLPRGSAVQAPANQTYTEPGLLHSGSDWRLAYSASAGLSYDVTKNLKLDSTYRYSNIAGGSGIPYGNTPGSSMSKEGFSVHQVKLGLRYEIW